jgi:predicted ester cyclase
MPPGPEGALQYRAMLHKAFPDLGVKIEDTVAEGDRVALRASCTGTQRWAILGRLGLERQLTANRDPG